MTQDAQTYRFLQQDNIRLRSENNSLRDYVGHLQSAIQALYELHRYLDTIDKEIDLFELLNTVLSLAVASVESDVGSLLLLDEQSGELMVAEVFGPGRRKLLHKRLPKDVGLASRVILGLRPEVVDDAQRQPHISPLVEEGGLESISLVCVPLREGKRPLGAIEVVNNQRDFTDRDLEVLSLLARLASLAVLMAEKAHA